MKYFLDTEFIEQRGHLQLISIGIVREDGAEFYMENADVDWSRADPWVIEHVKSKLYGRPVADAHIIGAHVREFVGDDTPEFWGYFSAYDWVLFCWLFGRMIDGPKGWPWLCKDLKQWADQLGVKREEYPADPEMEHNALADARWNVQLYAFLAQRAAA